MLTLAEKIAFSLLVLISLFLTFKSFSIMRRVIGRGKDRFYFDKPFLRIREALSVILTQKTVFKSRPFISFMHALIAWAFILYMLVNIGDVLQGFIAGYRFAGHNITGNIYRAFIDVFSVLAILAMTFFLIRRFLFNIESQQYKEAVLITRETKKGIRRDSLIVGFFIILHIGFRFIGESIVIHIEGPDPWQPLASFISVIWSPLSTDMAKVLHHISWWLAIGLILAFIPYFPSSKHAHLFMGPINYLLRPRRNAHGTLQPIDFEDESIEQFGVARLEHLEKKQILDAYACIMCNRCQDVCPAYVTGKALSPSALEINKRYFINNNKFKLASSAEVTETLLEYGLTESALWACTSCAACNEICPVGNEPMYDILNIRRDRVLMESQFPKQLQNAFNGMERNYNPWNRNEDRLKWTEALNGIDVKTVEENPEFEILYWVGCAGCFDQRGQKIAQSFAKLLHKAKVNFAVLGNLEKCTGDSARRSGNEYLFAMLASENVENLNRFNVKEIVATCPHCLHTIKNEYPQFGGNYKVLHHTELISQLIQQGKLSFEADVRNSAQITFHDPCYLGRHNQIYDAPRSDLNSAGYSISEMARNKSNSFCCGAGGAQMWKEEEEGREAVRHNRFKEAQKTGAEILCTSCPFCMTMLSDAANELNSSMQVKDIAQILAEKMI